MKNATKQSTTLTQIFGKELKQNSTHIAVLNDNDDTIEIWIKGFSIPAAGDTPEYISQPEYLYSIPAANSDDLFAIFERLDEDNRINRAEFIESQTPAAPTRPAVRINRRGIFELLTGAEFANFNWFNFSAGDIVYLNDKLFGAIHSIDEQFVTLTDLSCQMKNVRIAERSKSIGDVYNTGDNHSVTVFDIVRDYDASDIWSKEFDRGIDPARYFGAELIKKGVTIETVSRREFAEYIVHGILNSTK